MTEDRKPEQGSFEHYLRFGGDFVRALVTAIQRADPTNRERLRRAYPQMVAAFEDPTWFTAPAGFEPRYDADRPNAGMKVYVGECSHDDGYQVWIEEDGGRHALRQIPVDSPTGFAWGYAGSAAANLALAILADHTGDEQLAKALHQSFKWTAITPVHGDSFRITAAQVESWLRAKAAIGGGQ